MRPPYRYGYLGIWSVLLAVALAGIRRLRGR